MAKSKKPRKAYKQKPCVKPLGMRDSASFEIPSYVAVMALGQEHFCEQHVYNMVGHVDMVRRIAKNGDPVLPIAQEMVLALAEIQARSQRTDKHGVTGDEYKILQDGIGPIMAFLQKATNYQIDQATRAALREFDRAGALRV